MKSGYLYNKLLVIGLICLCNISQAQENNRTPGARYEDSIEKYRKKLFGPDAKKYWKQKTQKDPILDDPFNWWDAHDAPKKPKWSFHADAIGTRKNIQFIKNEKPGEYGDLKALTNFLLSLSSPPGRLVSTTTTISVPAPGTNTAPLYNPLLAYLQAGPGPQPLNGSFNPAPVGNLITLAHLQQITPALMNLTPLLAGNININQLLTTPQGIAVLNAAQTILQPLQMWNAATLNAWLGYIAPSSGQLITMLVTLQNQLNAIQNLPTTTTQTITTLTQLPGTNPLVAAAEIIKILKRKDRLEIAEKTLPLIDSVIGHEGFSDTQLLLYGSQAGNKSNIWPYKIGLFTERIFNDKRETYVFNESGFFVNKFASGNERYYQGPDDLSLVRLPIEVKDRRVLTLDVVSSDLHAWLKRASGGNLDLLERASTHSTSLLSLDIAFTENRDLHFRIVGGSTSTSSLGGVMGEIEYGSELFNGRIAGGFVHQDIYFANAGNLLGYLETENTLKTPPLRYINKKDQRGIRTWASITLEASALLHKPTTRPSIQGLEIDSNWGLQAEARLIPELYAQLTNGYALFEISGGMTTAVVPGGKADLKYPEKTLGLFPIRYHLGAKIRLRLSKILDEWSDKPQNLDRFFLELGFISEFSKISSKTRSTIKFDYSPFAIQFLLETEDYKSSSFRDVRIGGGASFRGIFATFLQSIENEDYRFEVGVDISSFWVDG